MSVLKRFTCLFVFSLLPMLHGNAIGGNQPSAEKEPSIDLLGSTGQLLLKWLEIRIMDYRRVCGDFPSELSDLWIQPEAGSCKFWEPFIDPASDPEYSLRNIHYEIQTGERGKRVFLQIYPEATSPSHQPVYSDPHYGSWL